MFSKRPLSVLLISTLSMIIAFSVWSVFAPIAADIQVMYSLTNAEKSVLIATPVLLGSLMRIPMGILTDRFGKKSLFFDYAGSFTPYHLCRLYSFLFYAALLGIFYRHGWNNICYFHYICL